MTPEDETRPALIDRIVGLEQEMFVAVVSETPAPCQQNTDAFRTMRRSQFYAWPDDALESYFDDLTVAKAAGKNLMTLKYARMDDRIPVLNTDPLIQEIVAIEVEWQHRLLQKYPALIGRGRPVEEADIGVSFKRYLAGELETYSGRTLACLGRHVKAVYRRGGNMSEDVYRHMVRSLGYQSLEEAEAVTAGREQ
ncbi:MAG: DUF4125 family protein [Thermodesulfobacteriota bacterium]